MGSDLNKLQCAPAGNIVGLGGIEEQVTKMGTLTSDSLCPNFVQTKSLSLGLIKVAIEAENFHMRDMLKEAL